MSEKKRVIKVKDLYVEAENVHFVQPERRRPVDPFFGRPRRVESPNQERESEVKSPSGEEGESSDERRRPFSWI
ncbi:hypothetical protein RZN22_03115 [Bacillaceae bacterium S4-13-58]